MAKASKTRHFDASFITFRPRAGMPTALADLLLKLTRILVAAATMLSSLAVHPTLAASSAKQPPAIAHVLAMDVPGASIFAEPRKMVAVDEPSKA